MKARFTSLKRILDLFLYHEKLSPKEIIKFSGLQKTIVHKYLKQLLEEWKLKKQGNAPHVYYMLSQKQSLLQEKVEDVKDEILWFYGYKEKIILDAIFLKFSPVWKMMKWMSGIVEWSRVRNLDVKEKINNYIKIHKYIESQQDNCWMLSADEAFWKDFEYNFLDKVFYADQYKYMDFWRWKLAEMTFYAKQSQNKQLIAESISEIFPKLECLIYTEKFDAIAITPWSIERKNQILGTLKKELTTFSLPFVNIIKYYQSGIAIPQKSLKTRNQRIENARNTIFIDDVNAKTYRKVLLIDDFVWSWATLNETAKKLKDEWVKQVYGFAFVGNTNLSYEVINEI